jgi:hypothetical protein
MEILNNALINHDRWDRCIDKSLNGNIYGLSWYLDITCPDWEGIVKGDYRAVMPLPVIPGRLRKTISQPPFTWQLGIYSNSIMDRNTVDAFISLLPPSYRIRNLDLNKLNSPVTDSFRYHTREHLELDLIPSYKRIREHYDHSLIEHLDKSGSDRLTVARGLTANEFLQFLSHRDRSHRKRLRPKEAHCLRLLIINSIRHRMGELYGAYTPENNLCAGVLIIRYRQKASLIYSLASAEGMQRQAVPFIIDDYIRSHAGEKLILGVDNPGDMLSIELLRQFGGRTCRFTRITGKA